MMVSLLVVLLAVAVGMVYFCTTNLKDKYCKNYYNPVQTQVLQAAKVTQQKAGVVYNTVSDTALRWFDVASQKMGEWYETGKEMAFQVHVSTVEMMSSGQETKDSGPERPVKT